MNQIGRYQIISYLGGGGMADVYRANDPLFGREVAIKVIKVHLWHNQKFYQRFLREAQVMASLTHPAIVPVHDFGEQNGLPYFVMALMKGGSLADQLQRRAISVKELVWILERLAPALDMAHARGVIHRDLKPDNILFDQQGNPYIADFGIAKLLAETTVDLSGTAVMMGTPAYMSPEQARGESTIDGRSDIYSLGVILFQSLSRQYPYNADTPLGLAYKHAHEPIPNIRIYRPDLPPSCQTVIAKAMTKQKEQRYQTVTEMVEAWKAVVEKKEIQKVPTPPPSPPPPPPPPIPWWQPWPILAGAAISLILITIVITLAITGGAENGPSEQGAQAMTVTPSANTPTSAPVSSTSTPALTMTGTPSTSKPTSTPILSTSTPALTSTPPPTLEAESSLQRGNKYYKDEDYNQAIKEYTTLIELEPNNAYAYNNRGAAYYHLGKYEAAIADYSEAIRLEPNDADLYQNRGMAYTQQGNYEQALLDYNQANQGNQINPASALGLISEEPKLKEQ